MKMQGCKKRELIQNEHLYPRNEPEFEGYLY
jgi:hypothetical protein